MAMRRTRPRPWYGNIPTRVRFERGVRAAYSDISSTVTGRGSNQAVRYSVTVGIPEYEARRLTIRVPNWSAPTAASVYADGPQESPHRYGKTRLCIWHPDDGSQNRWTYDDGLLVLIELSRVHLYREAYWRETGVWAGPEAPHGSLPEVTP